VTLLQFRRQELGLNECLVKAADLQHGPVPYEPKGRDILPNNSDLVQSPYKKVGSFSNSQKYPNQRWEKSGRNLGVKLVGIFLGDITFNVEMMISNSAKL